ncbi:MAG TPA: hypothetical protein PLV42_01710 [bacterium]|nr:hypothetical protein [bacterium]
MRHAVFIIALCALILPLTLAAQLGPDVATYKGEPLKWEEGSRDFFVMWKSLVQRTDGSIDTGPTNPQADSCIDPNVGSTYTLQNGSIPLNATVERAFLIWMAVVDPTQLNAPTDNSVTLSFQHSVDSTVSLSQEVTASYAGTLSTVSAKDFEFEGILTTDPSGGQDGIFTYRVEVTDFFSQIHAKANEAGITDPGAALFGDYNVKGVTCSAAEAYKTSSGLMAGWTLVFVYTSESVKAKKIYMYNGLQAYRFTSGDIQVSGFQLPNEAEIKFTLFVGEGDPGLYSALDPNTEGLQMHGPIDPNQPWLPLFDSCNPNMGNYVEVYNSISSVWAFGAQQETCVGNVTSKVLEYAMDVDTFLIRAKDEPFATHLHKDDTFFFLKVGANQDQVYTNLLVLSIDTKPPSFDIPAETAFSQNGREKDICTCAPSNEPDRICDDRPFYYVIKVQNWGENVADNVTVQDTLPPEVDYVAGTTEIATSFDGVNGTNWTAIPDNGGFPLANPYEVYPTMGYCDPVAMTCPDSVLVRFKVKPKAGLPKNQIIKNSAYISDSTGVSYQSNTSVPLMARFSSSCPPITECPEPPKELCGGSCTDCGPSCTKKEDCGANQDCVEGKCVDVPPGDLCTGTYLEYRAGDMSPSNGTAKIIVPAPSTGLALAQLAVKGTCNDGNNKSFSLDMIRARFELDTNVVLSNIRLIKDNDNSGTESTGDAVVSTLASLDAGYGEFAIDAAQRVLAIGADHNFLITADAAYAVATVPSETTFSANIEGKAAFIANDAGGSITNILDEKVEFATFMFEPSEGYFIFTKGPKEPAEPAANTLNKAATAVMHVRTKSLDGDNKIRSIKIDRMGSSTVFGEGMESVSIWEDTNVDGVGDTLLVTSGTVAEAIETYTFENLDANAGFQFSDKQERYYVINVAFKLEEGMTAQVQIPRLGVKLVDSTKKIIELPIQSRSYQCTAPFCEGGDGGGGCSCSIVTANDEPNGPWAGIVLLFAALGFAGFGLRSRRRDHSV